MSFDAPALTAAIARHGAVVRIVVLRSAGSVPRGPGTAMLVHAAGQDGTIGGGALEYRAVAEAREMLAGERARRHRTIPLGPGLGQCCGGSLTLLWERFTTADLPVDLPYLRPLDEGAPRPAAAGRAAAMAPGAAPLVMEGWVAEAGPAPRRALWIWGAGHVGRALVAVLAPLPDVAITWVDIAAGRFPVPLPDAVTPLVAADPALAVRHAPVTAEHLIVTHSHDIDLALCHALVNHGFGACGLIGSATKWARFRRRLAGLGHAPAAIDRIACPIGEPALGKHPHAIALGVAAALVFPTGVWSGSHRKTG